MFCSVFTFFAFLAVQTLAGSNQNIFLLIATNESYAHDLVQSAIVEDPTAFRLLVTVGFDLPETIFECYEQLRCTSPKHFCVDILIEMRENPGMGFVLNYALDSVRGQKQLFGQTNLIVATTPFMLLCPGFDSCEKSIFQVGFNGIDTEQENTAFLKIVPVAYSNMPDAHDLFNTFSMPMLLLSHNLIFSEQIHFEPSYVSIGAVLSTITDLLHYKSRDLVSVDKLTSREMVPTIWKTINTNFRSVKTRLDLHNTNNDYKHLQSFLDRRNASKLPEHGVHYHHDTLRQHDIDMFFINARNVLSIETSAIQQTIELCSPIWPGEQKISLWSIRETRSQIQLPHLGAERVRVGAIVCMHTDHFFLPSLIENLGELVDTIVILVGMYPWHGNASVETRKGVNETLSIIAGYKNTQLYCASNSTSKLSSSQQAYKAKRCSIAQRLEVLTGTWKTEGSQRSDGIRVLKEKKHRFDFALMVDSDEFWSPVDFRRLIVLASQPDIFNAHTTYRVSMKTYWKRLRIRINPPEKLKALVLVSLNGKCSCDTFLVREPVNCTCGTGFIDPQVAEMHHLSFVRTTKQLVAKITSFEHADEVLSGWFENVWTKWDTNTTMKNIHPTEPSAYFESVKQPILKLAPALRKLYVSSCADNMRAFESDAHRMICQSPFDGIQTSLVNRQTPSMFWRHRYLSGRSQCFDFVSVIIPGVNDMSTKPVFAEIAISVTEGLRQLGYSAKYVFCESLFNCSWKNTSNSVATICGNVHPTIVVIGSAVVTSTVYESNNTPVIISNERYLPKHAVLYQFEHLDHTEWFSQSSIDVYKSGQFVVWDYHVGNLEVYRRHGIKQRIFHVPYGFASTLIFSRDHQKHSDVIPEDIDVLYFGKVNKYRNSFVEALVKKNIKVFASHWLFGSDRDLAVKRAKIVINLRYWGRPGIYESKMSRILYLLSNKAFIISEYFAVEDEDTRNWLQNGMVFVKDDRLIDEFAETYVDHFASIVQYYLRDGVDARRQIALNGHILARQIPSFGMLKSPAESVRADECGKKKQGDFCPFQTCELLSLSVEVQHWVGYSTFHSFSLIEGDNPLRTILPAIQQVPNITACSLRMVMKQTQNIATRVSQRVYLNIPVHLDNLEVFVVPIRFGDDIDLIAYVFNKVHGGRIDVAILANHFKKEIKNIDSTNEWIAARELNDAISASRNRDKLMNQRMSPKKGLQDLNSVVVVFTTCKRLEKFMQTAKALLTSLEQQGALVYIHKFVVVDDGSSEEDLLAMRSAFPLFEFILKSPLERGHAYSLNIILWDERVAGEKSRFVLYFEDDWLVDSDHSNSWFFDSFELIQHAPEPNIGQVLLDDRHGGWPRSFAGSPRRAKTVKYRFHEFGVYALSSIDHTLPSWPGFSNQPGLWDIWKMRNVGLRFQVDEPLFEQLFSLDFYDSGLRVLCLQLNLTTHIGDDISSYKLNGLDQRYWDL